MWDEIRKMKPIERRPDGELFRLTPKQARRVWRLVKLCCNNVDGDCLLLDDGEGCACPQSIAYTLICKYFRRAVLPAEPELEEDMRLRRRKSLSSWNGCRKTASASASD